MPPLTSKKSEGGGSIEKDVEFVAKDDQEQVATGIVMVPDTVDLQADFIREDQIREFADQFENFEQVGEAGGGIMHAVFPDEWLDLERNEVLDEAEEIGGETAPAGAWVQSWAYNHDELWELVENGTFSGYSVGIDAVHWDGPYDQDDVEDVEIPEEIDDDQLVWQIVGGIMREVSTVDIPAVPDAMILDKAEAAKRLQDHLGNRDAFIEEAQERGHGEDAAEQMWDVLSEAAEIDGAGEPGAKTWRDRAKAFFSIGGPGAPDEPDTDTSAKEGRTLSKPNRDSTMAAVDANLDILEDAGIEHGMTRFTDQESVDFDLSEHDARAWSGDHDDDDEGGDADGEEGGEGEEAAASTANNDPDGETSEGGSTDAADDMSDNDNTDNDNGDGAWDEAPDWAKDLRDTQEQNSKRLDEQSDQIEAALDTEQEEEKTAEVEIDGEIYEVTESQAKAWFDEDANDGAMDDAPEWAKSIKSDIDAQRERLDRINRQSGGSHQLGATATNGSGGGGGGGGEGGEQEENLKSLGELLN